MKNWIKVVLFMFVYVASPAQIPQIPCGEDYRLSKATNEAFIDTLMIVRGTNCPHPQEVVVDIQTYQVPDKVCVDTGTTFCTHWVGLRQYLQDSLVIVGYAEYWYQKLINVGGAPPSDFSFNTRGTYWGKARLRFETTKDTFYIYLIGNPTRYTEVLFHVKCNRAFTPPDTTYKTEYSCKHPINKRNYIYNGDCGDVLVLDSIQSDKDSLHTDTLRVHKDDLIRVFGQSIKVTSGWQKYDSSFYDKDSCLVFLVKCLWPYDGRYYAPNVFSPNHDGINDYFTVWTNDEAELKELEVYSRWGELLYRGDRWDGTFHGEVVNPGAYTYKALVLEGDRYIIIAGSITVIE